MAEGLVLQEQRSLIRRELIYYLKISDRKTGLEIGRMGDVHTQGMLVLSEKPLAVGSVYSAALELPKAMHSADKKEVFLQFEVVWSRSGPKNSTYQENGVRFIAIDERLRETVGRLIDLFAMPGL